MQKLDFIEELRWRNMLHDYTPGLLEFLAEGMKSAYIGFDPTAKSLGLGNYVQIMLLTLFQRSGHRPIVLMGGATGRIGDPSGKDKERELLSYDELDENIKFQEKQFRALLNFEDGENRALLLNNFNFYKEMSVLDFLRKVGKNMTINYMLSKEAVKKRLEVGISFTEFSYQLLQAYDFYNLYKEYDCKIQMGGSDQWGNITSGTEYIGKVIEGSKAFAVTTPLLTKSDGKKFGKTEEGNIFLDPQLTSTYKFYQFWINCDDADLKKLYRYFSLKSKEEVEALELKYIDQPKELKRILAEEITCRVHGEKAFTNAFQVSELIFNKDCSYEYLSSLDFSAFEQLKHELPFSTVKRVSLDHGMNVIQFLTEATSIFVSKSEARRAIQGNSVSINKKKVDQLEELIYPATFIKSKYIMLENGKKNKYLIELI